MMKGKQTKTRSIHAKQDSDKDQLNSKNTDMSLDEIQYMVHDMCENAFSKNTDETTDSSYTTIHHQRHQQSKNQYISNGMAHDQVRGRRGRPPIRSSYPGKYSHNRAPEGRRDTSSFSNKIIPPTLDEDLDEKYDVKIKQCRDHEDCHSRSIGRQIHDCLHSSISFAKITVEFKDNINCLHESSRNLLNDHESITNCDQEAMCKVTSLTCRDIARKADTHMQGSLMTLQHEIQSALFSVKKIIDEMKSADGYSCDFIGEER